MMMCTQESSPEAASGTTLQVVENDRQDAAPTSTAHCETSPQDHAAAAVVVVTESEESDTSEDEEDAAKVEPATVQPSHLSINNKLNNQPINPIQQEQDSSGDEYSSSDDDEKGEEASSSSESSDDEDDNNFYSAAPAPAPAPTHALAPIPAPIPTTAPQQVAPPGPIFIYDAAMDPELEAKNIILAVLTHGAKCQARGRCPFPNCTQAKAMVRHVSRCKEINNACGMSYCANAKFVLRFAQQIQMGILKVARDRAANDPFVMRMRAAALATAAAGGGTNAVSARRAAPRRQFSSTMPRWTSRTLETIQEEREHEDEDSDNDSGDDDEGDNDPVTTLASGNAMAMVNTMGTEGAKCENNDEDSNDESDSSDEVGDDGQVSTLPTSGRGNPMVVNNDEDNSEESDSSDEDGQVSTLPIIGKGNKVFANGNIQPKYSTKSKVSNWDIEYSDDESDDEGSPIQSSALQPNWKPRVSATSVTSSNWETDYSDDEESDGKADVAEMKTRKHTPIEYSDDDESDDEGFPQQSTIPPTLKSSISAVSVTSSNWEIEYSDDEESDDEADLAEMATQNQATIEYSADEESDDKAEMTAQKPASSDEEDRRSPEPQDFRARQESSSAVKPGVEGQLAVDLPTGSLNDPQDDEASYSNDTSKESHISAVKETENENVLAVENVPMEAQTTCKVQDQEKVSREIGTSEVKQHQTSDFQAPGASKPTSEHATAYEESKEDNKEPPEPFGAPCLQEGLTVLESSEKQQQAINLPQEDTDHTNDKGSKLYNLEATKRIEPVSVRAVATADVASNNPDGKDDAFNDNEESLCVDVESTPCLPCRDQNSPQAETVFSESVSLLQDHDNCDALLSPDVTGLHVADHVFFTNKAVLQGGNSSSPPGADVTDAHLTCRDDDNSSKASSGDGGYITADSVFSSDGDISSDDDDNNVDTFEDGQEERASRSEPQSTSDGSVFGEDPRAEMVPVPSPVPQMAESEYRVVDNGTAEPAQDGVSSTADVNEKSRALQMDNRHEAIEADCSPSGVQGEIANHGTDLPLGPDGIGLAKQEGIETDKKPKNSDRKLRTRDDANTDTPSSQASNDPDIAVPIIITDSSALESDTVNDELKAAEEDREETLVEGSISDLCHPGVHEPHEEGEDSVPSLVLQIFSDTAENAKNAKEGAEDISVSAIAWKSFVFEESSSLLRWDPASSGAPNDLQNGSNSGMQRVYQNVRYHKMVGFLSLAPEGIRFVFSGHHAMDLDRLDPLTISWSEVEKQQKSPPPYAFLKFLLTNGKAHAFQFDGRESLEDVIADVKKCLRAHRSKQNKKQPDTDSPDQVSGENNSKMELDKNRGDIAHEDSCLVAGDFKSASKVDQEMATRKEEEAYIVSPGGNSDEDAVASSACDHERKDNRFRLNDSKSQTLEVMASNHSDTRATTGSGDSKNVNRDIDPSTPVSRTQTHTSEVDEVNHIAKETAGDVDCPGKEGTNLKKADAVSALSCGSDRDSTTLYSPVYFKSVEGSLSVNENNLRFQSSKEANGKYTTKTLPYKNIAKHHTSPQKVPKAMLKVVSTEGKAVTFEVQDRDVLEKLAKEVTERRCSHQAKTQNKEPTKSTLPSPACSLSTADVVKVGWQKVGGSKQNSTPLSLHVFDGIDFKGAKGSIHLSKDSFCFLPSSDQDSIEGSTTIPWKDVLKHQGSPRTHAKALLKLVLTNGQSMTFELNRRDELTQLRRALSSSMKEVGDETNRSYPGTSADKAQKSKKKAPENAETQSSTTECPNDYVRRNDLVTRSEPKASDTARNDAKEANDGRKEDHNSMSNQPAGHPKKPDKREKSLKRMGIGVVKKLTRSLSWKKPSK